MTQSIARNSAFNVVAGLSTTIGGFVSTILVARLLGVEGTGIVAFATWIVTIVIVSGDLGIPGAMARYLPELRSHADEGTVSSLVKFLLRRFLAVLTTIFICFAGYAAFVAFAEPGIVAINGDNYRHVWTFWAIVGLACATQGLASFTNGYLKGTESFGLLARIAMISAVMQILTTLAGIWLLGVAGAMLAAVLGFIIPAALVVLAARRHGPPIEPALKQRVSRFAWEAWGGYVVMAFAWSRMEIYFLERSWGSEAAGIFSVSLTLTNLATQAPILLTAALLPFLSRNSGTDNLHRAREGYAVGARLMAFIVFPACFGVAAIAPKLLPALFGEDFSPAVPTTMVLLAAAAFSATANVATIYLMAMEKPRVVFATGGLGAILAITVGLVAVPVYGPMAAAIGRAAIQILVVIVMVWYVQRRLNCPAPYASLAKLFLAAAGCGGVAYVIVRWLDGPWDLPAAVISGALAYAVLIRLLRPLPDGDIERLVTSLKILPGPLHRAGAALIRLITPVRST